MQKKIVPRVHRIAVLRANQLGDFIVALPALQAIKNTYPQAELVLLAKPWTGKFMEARPSPIDRIISVPVSKGVRIEDGKRENKEDLRAFFRLMKKERFDIAVQMHGGGKDSNRFIKKLGAQLTVGSRTKDAERLDRYIPYSVYQNEVLRYLEIAALIGARTADVAPHLTVLKNDTEETKRSLHELAERYVVLHPGASDPLRRWDPARFAQVADSLADAGYQVVITGMPAEAGIVQEVASRMKHDAVNACSRLTLNGLTGLLAHSSLLISNDTGPLHLAQAIGTKNIGIFWGYNIINWGPTTGSGTRIAASWIVRCPDCGRKLTGHYDMQVSFPVCSHRFSLLSEIEPKEVFYLAEKLLQR